MAREVAGSSAREDHRDLALELAEALARDQFFLVYQPTIDLQTNAFAGVEALIRWRHEELGVLSPDSFIEELEASGEIVSVGRWALDTACAQGAVWHDKGYRFSVSVNVSEKQFTYAYFVKDVATALAASRFDPGLLVLEFAQDVLFSNRDTSTTRLGELRALGVKVAVDDFSPATSNLDELAIFDVDVVKLDREFIAGITDSSEAARLVHELVQSSDDRHVQVIASGIEDAAQRTQLQSENVHVGQGFLFSKPHEAAEIDTYLQDFAIFSGKPL